MEAARLLYVTTVPTTPNFFGGHAAHLPEPEPGLDVHALSPSPAELAAFAVTNGSTVQASELSRALTALKLALGPGDLGASSDVSHPTQFGTSSGVRDTSIQLAPSNMTSIARLNPGAGWVQ